MTIRLIAALNPQCGVLENVCGLRTAANGETSALAMLLKELEALGFSAGVLEMNMSTFAEVTRSRSGS